MNSLLIFITYYTAHCILDVLLRACRIKATQYLFQSVHHLAISIMTVSTVYQTLFHSLPHSSIPYHIIAMTTAFDLYRISRIFHFHDWFELILTTCVALPLGLRTMSPCLIGYYHFFLCVPFGFDYFLLFLYQNRRCSMEVEIDTNQWLHTRIRKPLIDLHYLLTIKYLYEHTRLFDLLWWSGILSILLIEFHQSSFRRHQQESHYAMVKKM